MLFHSRGPATEKLLSRSVTVSVGRHTCRRRKTWDVDVPRPWQIHSRPTGTAEQDHAMTCKQAPPIWSRFSVSQATSGAVSALEWYVHSGKHQRRAVPTISKIVCPIAYRTTWFLMILNDLEVEGHFTSLKQLRSHCNYFKWKLNLVLQWRFLQHFMWISGWYRRWPKNSCSLNFEIRITWWTNCRILDYW